MTPAALAVAVNAALASRTCRCCRGVEGPCDDPEVPKDPCHPCELRCQLEAVQFTLAPMVEFQVIQNSARPTPEPSCLSPIHPPDAGLSAWPTGLTLDCGACANCAPRYAK